MKKVKPPLFILINTLYVTIIGFAVKEYARIFGPGQFSWKAEWGNSISPSQEAISMLITTSIPLLCTAVIFHLLSKRYKFDPLYNRLSYIAALLVPAPYLCGVAVCYLFAIMGFYSILAQYITSFLGITIGVGCILTAIPFTRSIMRNPRCLACIISNTIIFLGYLFFAWPLGAIVLLLIADWNFSIFAFCGWFFVAERQKNLKKALLLTFWNFIILETMAAFAILIGWAFFRLIIKECGFPENESLFGPGGARQLLTPIAIVFINRSAGFIREVYRKTHLVVEEKMKSEAVTIMVYGVFMLAMFFLCGYMMTWFMNSTLFISILLLSLTLFEILTGGTGEIKKTIFENNNQTSL